MQKMKLEPQCRSPEIESQTLYSHYFSTQISESKNGLPQDMNWAIHEGKSALTTAILNSTFTLVSYNILYTHP